MEDRIYTVSEINKGVKRYLERSPDFKEIFIRGEISNINYYKSGHLYFTLKDKGSQLKCAAFSYKFKKIPENLEKGDLIEAFGDITLYEARGDYQLLVRHIRKEDKVGELFRRLEEVKTKLDSLGYFNREHKKDLPLIPKAIGIVTSGSGAAIEDIINTAKLRFENIDIYIYPAKVQGDGSKEEVIRGIKTLDKIDDIDVIICGRGGGSVEDLWTFNEEEVAMAYFNTSKPIVSAVGHEIDFLLTDLTADRRASTPTHASEIVVPVKKQLLSDLKARQEKLNKAFKDEFSHKERDIQKRYDSYIIKNFKKILNDRDRDIIQREENLERSALGYILEKERDLKSRVERLKGVDPNRILDLGYSIVLKGKKPVKGIDDIEIGDTLTIKLKDGNIKTIAKEKK